MLIFVKIPLPWQVRWKTMVWSRETHFKSLYMCDDMSTSEKSKAMAIWKKLSPTEANWEFASQIQRRFPSFSLEDKGSYGGSSCYEEMQLLWRKMEVAGERCKMLELARIAAWKLLEFAGVAAGAVIEKAGRTNNNRLYQLFRKSVKFIWHSFVTNCNCMQRYYKKTLDCKRRFIE